MKCHFKIEESLIFMTDDRKVNWKCVRSNINDRKTS